MSQLLRGVAVVWILASILAPAAFAEKLKLARGQRLLVMQSRDLIYGGKLIQGSGSSVFQVVHNTLSRHGLTPLPGTYAATVNALEEGRQKGCAFVVRPNLERFSGDKAIKQGVGLTIDFLDPSSGEVAASCVEASERSRFKGARVQEMLRSTVDDCLAQVVELDPVAESLTPGDTPVGLPLDRFLVTPRREFWLLPSDETAEGYEVLVELVTQSLENGGHEAEGAPPKSNRFKLFDHARKEKFNRMLAVGVGVVWTGAEPPPDDASAQLIVSLVDVSSKRILQTVIAQTTDGSWAGRGADLADAAVRKILGQSTDGIAEGIALSLLEPAIVIKDKSADYPRGAKKKRKEGTVVVGLLVDEHGEVQDVRAVESNPLFDKAAIKAAQGLRFVPARRDGEVCPIHMEVRYEFKVARRPSRAFSRF